MKSLNSITFRANLCEDSQDRCVESCPDDLLIKWGGRLFPYFTKGLWLAFDMKFRLFRERGKRTEHLFTLTTAFREFKA